MSLLQIEQKAGSKDYIDGRLIVYAIVDLDPAEIISASHPVSSMVHNGLLVAQGNYKEQNSIKDFLKTEMGESFEEGLEEFLDKLNGLEGALDPQKLKEKMKNLDDLKDFIPTPAKIVPFHSESEILKQEGDVFCVGSFKNIANANLSVNSFPILYQARYREQEIDMIRSEIEQLISQVEVDNNMHDHYTSSGIDIENNILKDYIPTMLYGKKEKTSFESSIKKFKNFMLGYKFSEDIDRIITIIQENDILTPKHYRLLELYAKKINEVCNENFSQVELINKDISRAEDEILEE